MAAMVDAQHDFKRYGGPAYRPAADEVTFLRYPAPGKEEITIKGGHVRRHGPPGIHEGELHYELELGIVLEGAWELRFDTARTVAGPGDVWLTGPCEPHLFGTHSTPCEFVWLGIMPHILTSSIVPGAESMNWLAPFMAPLASRPKVPVARRPAMLALGRRLAAVLDEPPQPARQAQLMLLALEILLLLQRDWVPGEVTPLPPRAAYNCASDALRIVFESTGRLPAHQVASKLGISRFRFHRLFQRTMGISFAKFALRLRLSHAAHELRAAEDSVKQIAQRSGFVDTSHFVHAFKAHYDCTPSAYRSRYATGCPSDTKQNRKRDTLC